MSSIIKVENLSKQYRLGEIGTGSLSHDVNRWWHRVRGKENPYLKIGETNDRSTKGTSEYVWSLKDINFEIEQGDAVGIIGRNGAGKSTLLKILSRVTGPTTGSVKVKGRIASLLEVGTGFHPELSGRDNIFLNGAILGMRKHEIQRKFDEIVDFSGVERYIDTPVKRYSSGMYVRLAFAVAAHLESEILIVDEVLAVGDAEFQKKCLGKMNDVSKGEGRTILFVSHNLDAIKNLCDSCIWLDNGIVKNQGAMPVIIDSYLGTLYNTVENSGTFDLTTIHRQKLNSAIFVNKVEISYDGKVTSKVPCFSPFKITLKINAKENFINPIVSLVLKDINNRKIIGWRTDESQNKEAISFVKGDNTLSLEIPSIDLLPNKFKFSLGIKAQNEIHDYIEEFGHLEFYLNVETKHIKHTDLLITSKVKWSLDS